MSINLVWIRNDLRISDNPALHFACKNNNTLVLTLFIATPIQWQRSSMAPRKALLIYKNLNYLKNKITKLGISFFYYESTDFCESINYLIYFCKKYKINAVFFNYEYGFYEQKRDSQVLKKLKNNKIFAHTFHDSILFKPESITNRQGTAYKKYSFFKKQYIKKLQLNKLKCFPSPKKRNVYIFNTENNIPIFNYPIKTFDENLFPIGEELVINKLKYFIKNKLYKYIDERDIPSLCSTSMLSAHLSIGVLTSRQCIFYLLDNYYEKMDLLLECYWVNELIWREFYRHLLYFYPDLSQQHCLCPWGNNIKWQNNLQFFNLWKQGKTGYPIVDAGMRQLSKLGWMNNRLRMITASFLVKNLCIDWKKGEKYFMSQLIDGDIASNSGGWQWIASVGTDCVPYFRTFNPILQTKKIDFNKDFIYQYIPELKKLQKYDKNKTLSNNINKINNYKYLSPIVDYFYSKKTVYAIFKHAKNNL